MDDLHAALGERAPSPGYSWIGLLAAPLVAFADQQVGYLLVYISCANQTRAWLLLASFVAALLVAALGWRGWRGWTETRDPTTVSGFLNLVGALVSGMSFLLVLAMAVTRVVLFPCAR